MGVCREYRISHSHFLGGPPIWTAADRDKAIWDQLRRAQMCQQCGTHPDDWDPDKGGSRDAYTAIVRRCPGCAATEQKRAELDSDPDKGRGETVGLKRREDDHGVDPGPHGRDVGVEESAAQAPRRSRRA